MSHKIDHFTYFCRFEILKGIKIALLVQKLRLLNGCNDYSALWHCGNCNLTMENPQISTRRHQTPDKGIVTLWPKWPTQEVFVGFHFMGKIERSQICLGQKLKPSAGARSNPTCKLYLHITVTRQGLSFLHFSLLHFQGPENFADSTRLIIKTSLTLFSRVN